jgi:hypothetical protein
MTVLLLVLLAAVVAIVLMLQTWLLVHLRRQGDEIDRRSAELQRRVALHHKNIARRRQGPGSHPAGLPAQSILNDFELPALDGGNMTFSQWRGTRIAVIFVQPDCPYSRRVIDTIGSRRPEEPQPIFVSTGDVDVNRELFWGFPEEIPILLQAEVELARVWRVTTSPSAYVVDPLGVTEGGLLQGESEITRALNLRASDGTEDVGPRTTQLAPALHPFPRPPEIGTLLPDIEITLLSGVTTTVQSTIPTLVLVFDPTCRPCLELLPKLPERAATLAGHCQFLVLCRGEIRDAWELANAIGVSASVSHQATGKVMRRLGMVQTPSALLIDPAGRISAEPALGGDAILTLLDTLTASIAEFAPIGTPS